MAPFAMFAARSACYAQRTSILLPRLALSPSSTIIRRDPTYFGNSSPDCRQQIHSTNVLSSGASHSLVWKAERVVSVSLLGIIPAAYFVGSTPIMDLLLSVSLIVHSHWGLQTFISDYMHGYPGPTGERKHPWLAKLQAPLVYTLSMIALACLLNFNLNDVGLIKAISMLWKA